MVSGAYKLRVFLLFLVTSAILSGCSKTNYRWLYYDETYCADKWDRHMVNEKLKENIVSYLNGRGIKVVEIEIFSDRVAESCSACTCKSGRRIKCKVRKRSVKDLKNEGFYQ